MDKQAIDIVILTYNRKEFLERTLGMLSNQTRMDFNLIVTSDGCRQEEQINPHAWPIVTKYMWSRDQGYYRVARHNEAIDLCVSDKLVLLDDDCLVGGVCFVQAYIELLDQYHVARGILSIGNTWLTHANIGYRTQVMRDLGKFHPEYNGGYGFDDNDMAEKIALTKLTVAEPTDARTHVVHVGGEYADGDRSDNVIGRNKRIYEQRWGVTWHTNGWADTMRRFQERPEVT